MKKSLAILFLSFFVISCSPDDDLLTHEENLEILKDKDSPSNARLYIPPGATTSNVPVTFTGCVTYVLNVQIIKYNSSVVIAPDASIFNNQGSSTIYIDVVPSPYGSIISTQVSSSNQYVFVNSSLLNGSTSFYWRMRVVNSGYNCWPNPTSWNFETL